MNPHPSPTPTAEPSGRPRPEPQPPAVAAGAVIGRYRVVSRLGVGGMGEVLLARVTGAGGFEKEVVLKRILPHLATDPDFVRRFIEEGKLVVKLRHAGIAQVLDMGEDNGVVYLAMEHVDGKDLHELTRLAKLAGLKMPRELVIFVLIELLEALDYAHHAKDGDGAPLNLIHRDVTPSNVMISKSGEVKLLDFGIARATERLQTSVSGAIRGKFGYMSPQQAAGLELDLRSDLFSVGVMAWELLAGERPFDGASDLLTLDRVRSHDPGPLSAVVPEVSPALSSWVGKMLSKEPDARFATAHEAALALRSMLMAERLMPGARDLSRWYEQVVATLPDGLKNRPMQGLSLDELLALGLPGKPLAPRHEVRAETALVEAAPIPPISSVAPVMPGAPGPAETADPPRRSRRLAVTLILINLVLVALVLVLVLTDGDPGEAAGLVSGADAVGGGQVPDTVMADTVGAEVVSDVGPMASTDTLGALAGAASRDVAVEVVAAPVASGSLAGMALGDLPFSVFEEELELTVRSQPPGATLAIAGLGTAPSPRTVKARRGVTLSGRATLTDHAPRAFEVVVGDDAQVVVTLKATPRGTVRFRFFPAEGTVVEIDGRPIGTSGNTVAAELATGEHTLTLLGQSGQKLVKRFVVEEGKATNLGTIELGP